MTKTINPDLLSAIKTTLTELQEADSLKERYAESEKPRDLEEVYDKLYALDLETIITVLELTTWKWEREAANPVESTENQNATLSPTIYVEIREGVVEAISSDSPKNIGRVVTIDYDTEGGDQTDFTLIEYETGKFALAYVREWEAAKTRIKSAAILDEKIF